VWGVQNKTYVGSRPDSLPVRESDYVTLQHTRSNFTKVYSFCPTLNQALYGSFGAFSCQLVQSSSQA